MEKIKHEVIIKSREEILAEIKKLEDMQNNASLLTSKIIDDIQLKLAGGDESKVGLYSDEDWGEILLEKQANIGNEFEDIIGILKSNA